MPIESNRSLGGIGSYLTLLGVISTALSIVQIVVWGSTSQLNSSNLGILGVTSIIGFLSFIGFILFLVAMYGFSRDYSERRIFSFVLYGLLGAIVIAAVTFAIWFAFTISSIISSIPSLNPSPSQSDIQSILTPYFGPFLPIISVAGLIFVILLLKAFNLLAEKSEVPLFRTGAKLFLVGAIINIAVAVLLAALAISGVVDYQTLMLTSVPGGIVQYVAWAVTAKAFFKIKAPPKQTFSVSNPPASLGQVKYCPHCGTANQLDSTYCIQCGQKL